MYGPAGACPGAPCGAAKGRPPCWGGGGAYQPGWPWPGTGIGGCAPGGSGCWSPAFWSSVDR
ncbi:hypothetical protein ACVILE_002131 [Streptomyces sp. M18.1]